MPDIVKIILFCSGNGSDPNSYRPLSDETQWWGRRDALVRCVSSAMAMASAPEIRLVLLFDGDNSALRMQQKQLPEGTEFLPTEQNLVRLWKRAAQRPHQWVEQQDMQCRLDRFGPSSLRGSSRKSNHNTVSKRERLETLQATCSQEFLREHRVSGSIPLLLRKTNLAKLEEVEKLWHSKKRKRSSPMADYIAKVLQPDNPLITDVVSATLHESSENELPCWDEDCGGANDESHSTRRVQLCLFLGAVRDMTNEEYDCLPPSTLRIRLGPVPEFTSKILSVVAFHHAHQRLIPATLRLQRAKQQKHSSACLPKATCLDLPSTFPRFHFVCCFPELSEISTALNKRSLALWCLVRCTVAALWRSNVARRKQDNRETTRFTAVLGGSGQHATATESMLFEMAERHEAAPSEYQVLKAWKAVPTVDTNRKSIDELIAGTTHVLDCTVSAKSPNLESVRHRFYKKIDPTEKKAFVGAEVPESVVVLLAPLGPCLAIDSFFDCSKTTVVVAGDTIANTNQHGNLQSPSATFTYITMIQHLAYQSRLAHHLHLCGLVDCGTPDAGVTNQGC